MDISKQGMYTTTNADNMFAHNLFQYWNNSSIVNGKEKSYFGKSWIGRASGIIYDKNHQTRISKLLAKKISRQKTVSKTKKNARLMISGCEQTCSFNLITRITCC